MRSLRTLTSNLPIREESPDRSQRQGEGLWIGILSTITMVISLLAASTQMARVEGRGYIRNTSSPSAFEARARHQNVSTFSGLLSPWLSPYTLHVRTCISGYLPSTTLQWSPTANLIGFAGQELARKLPRVFGTLHSLLTCLSRADRITGVILETFLGSIVEIVLFMVLLSQDDGGDLIPVIQVSNWDKRLGGFDHC